MTITEFIEGAAHNKIIQLVVLAIVCDTVFGVLRAIKEKKFNSCAGIDGAIRKVVITRQYIRRKLHTLIVH